MNQMTSIVTTLSVLSLLLFAILTNTIIIYAQQVPTNVQQVSPPSSPLSSSPISKLHTVKITSPAKGQQVPIGKDLIVSGITTTTTGGGNATSHRQVSVIANGIKPYQPATATGPGGAADYSKWNFVLSSKYTTIKQGPDNKITAKYICSNNPSAASFYSVNVIGAGTTTPGAAAAPSTTGPSSAAAATKTTTGATINPAPHTIGPSPTVYTGLPTGPSSATTTTPPPAIEGTAPAQQNNKPIVYNNTTSTNNGTNTGNLAGISYLGYHRPNGGSSDVGGSGSIGKASIDSNSGSKVNPSGNHPFHHHLNNKINAKLKNSIMDSVKKQLKSSGVQLPLPLPF